MSGWDCRRIFSIRLQWNFFGNLNFLKGGIVFSDALTTVSRGYSKEIQTEERPRLWPGRAAPVAGRRTYRHREWGVDYNEWSPEEDRYIACPYSLDQLEGKRQCKQDLLETFHLPSDDLDIPVIGIVSRFATQKGFDLIEEIIDELAEEDVHLTAIGTGEPQYEDMFRRLATAYPDKFAVRVTYNDELAHKIEAGADMFLMPSRYEPCGLNQIYSLRYGTIPIVRATGGLDDTIDDTNGFKFHEYSGSALLGTIRIALKIYQEKARWQLLVRNAMQADFSWNASAAEYSQLYRRMVT